MKIEDEIKQKKFLNAHQKAVINLLYTVNWLQGKHQHLFKSFNITPQQFNILRILKGQHPNSISATEIKSRMLDRNSDVSRLLDRLVSKNVIVRKACPTDKRASDVNLTDAGLELLRTIDKKQSELDNILSLSDEEALQLSNLLDKSRG
ncbi:MarR family winged helix-turn-helix transcriptional regulator [Chryseolinea lacunae]|uniref:MarR family transcriptional regulator n=1 Tax=Chryseolinea lacunae TaxID=2801331 RepID=A0ABS1L1Z5_9BACT|nr:MarR family transcriptional regulator [Chryseolinea lacunae]MBL0744546.1 MarR family transcriptional regulator [Chryseolinea lacunae]